MIAAVVLVGCLQTDLDIANTQLALWKDNAATLNLPPVNDGKVSNFVSHMHVLSATTVYFQFAFVRSSPSGASPSSATSSSQCPLPVTVCSYCPQEEQMELERLRTTSAALQQELGKLRRQVAQHKAAFETARKGGEELGKRAAEQAAAQQLEGLRSELRESQVKGSLVWVVVCCGRP